MTACAGHFRIEVIDQSWVRPMRCEASVLDIRPDAYALVRHVHLVCGDASWVYARTVIPSDTLTGRARRLACLKSRSLGSLLFSDPSMRRREMQIACIAPGHKLFDLVTRAFPKPPHNLWGRRAVFTLASKPLLVSEVFLPAIGEFPTWP